MLRTVAAVVLPLAALAALHIPAAGQSKTAAKAVIKKTPWGDPDLQGVWTGTEMIGVPMQRPANFGERNVLTEEEFKQRQAKRQDEEEFDTAEFVSEKTKCDPNRGGLGNTPDTCKDGVSIGPPLYWQDRGTPNHQASLIVDPSNGRTPPLTAEAQKIAADRAAARRGHGPADTFEDRSAWERCITRGAVGFVPTGYNNGNQIMQAPGYVILRIEMIHETRVVPLDARPHVGKSVQSYNGDARGHFEGDTLVVETTNFTPNTAIGGTALSDAAKLVERFTPADGALNYEVTVEDPKTWTKPWKMSFPLKRESDYTLYEYACHEGNYTMYNALTGARQQERAAANKGGK
jgi:hypothetical protein